MIRAGNAELFTARYWKSGYYRVDTELNNAYFCKVYVPFYEVLKNVHESAFRNNEKKTKDNTCGDGRGFTERV